MSASRQRSATIAKPILLALPGLDGTGRLFGDFTRAVGHALELRVVSYPPDRPLGYMELTAITQAALPAGRPFLLLGESFSGPIALTLAATRPPGLCGVILCASFARNPLPWLRPMAPCLRAVPVHAAPSAAIAWLLLGRWSTPSRLAAIKDVLRGVAPVAINARIDAVLHCDMLPSLEKIGVPLLYLRARSDRLIPSAASRLLRRHRPDTTFVSIDGPHLLLQTASEPAAAAILDFASRLPAFRVSQTTHLTALPEQP